MGRAEPRRRAEPGPIRRNGLRLTGLLRSLELLLIQLSRLFLLFRVLLAGRARAGAARGTRGPLMVRCALPRIRVGTSHVRGSGPVGVGRSVGWLREGRGCESETDNARKEQGFHSDLP